MTNDITADGTSTEVRTSILEDLGFENVVENTAKLILWNDHVNDMVYVVLALMTICQLNPDEAQAVMYEAHEKGKAVAKTGEIEEIKKMKEMLNDARIEATVEL